MKTDKQIDNWKTGRKVLLALDFTAAQDAQDVMIDLRGKTDPKSYAYHRELIRLIGDLGATYTQVLETIGRAKESLAD